MWNDNTQIEKENTCSLAMNLIFVNYLKAQTHSQPIEKLQWTGLYSSVWSHFDATTSADTMLKKASNNQPSNQHRLCELWTISQYFNHHCNRIADWALYYTEKKNTCLKPANQYQRHTTNINIEQPQANKPNVCGEWKYKWIKRKSVAVFNALVSVEDLFKKVKILKIVNPSERLRTQNSKACVCVYSIIFINFIFVLSSSFYFFLFLTHRGIQAKNKKM